MNNRLSNWETENSVIADNQNGFRKQRSTIDQISSLTSIIETRKLHNKDTFAAFIDFKKAYDSIDRGILFTKHSNLGISGLMYNALLSIYDNVRCAVRINGKLTEWFNVSCGLKQGCSLSSILFNLYINDLIIMINSLDIGIEIDGEKVGILAYADDVVFLAENEHELQLLMNELNIWCDNNKLEVNVSKSKIIHFRNQSKPVSTVEFRCGRKTLETVSQYVYLGLPLTEHLDYEKMAKQVANSASRALGLLITKFKMAGGFPFSTFTKLYNSTVLSVINYGASIWGSRRFTCVKAVQNRALRFFLGVGRYAPNAAVNGDSGWDSIYLTQWRCVMNQWCRIKRMDQSRLNRRIYQWSVNHGNFRSKNWAYRIKQLMDDCNTGDLFTTGSENINKSFIINRISEYLKTQDNQTWINDVTRLEARRGNGRNKLRTYKLFKTAYEEENYVKIIMQRNHRSAFAKFRMGIAPLRIETGRYERLKEEERTCFHCTDTVESEEHVLLVCPLYHQIREPWFAKLREHVPDFYTKTRQDKLICIFSCEIIPVIRLSAKICNDILSERRKQLYK